MLDKPCGQDNTRDWFLRGEHHLRSAKLLLGLGGPTETIAVLVQQASEMYLKGYLLGRGWRLRRTHDLEVLVSEAARHDVAFEQFLDFARLASAYYVEDRYSPGPPTAYPADEMANAIDRAEHLIELILRATG